MSTSDSTVTNYQSIYSNTRISTTTESVEKIRKNGREYLVFPVIALREMVLNYPENGTKELLPAESFTESSHMWSGTPLVYVHPENAQQTAKRPDSYIREVIGQVFRPEIVDDEKLRVQAWLDVEKARDIGGLAEKVVEKLNNGEELSVSAGYGTVEDDFEGGTYQDETYDLEQGTVLPDHVAVFPSDEFRARCGLDDGCGAPRVNSRIDVSETEVPADVKLNVESGQYVKWEWQSGFGYGQVVEVVEDGCRSVEGNEKCTESDTDERVVVLQHFSENGTPERQRVVKYERNLQEWDEPDDAESVTNFYNNASDVPLCGCLDPEPVSEDLLTNVEVDGEEIDLTPPDQVQTIAQDFLNAVDDGLVPDSCATSSKDSTGYQRAEQLASGEELAVEDITAQGDGMYSWFARHGAQGSQKVDLREKPDDMSEREFRYQDCGYAAWRSWGGDAARNWVNKVYEQITDAQSKANASDTMSDEDDPATHLERFLTAVGVGGTDRQNTASEQSDSDTDESPDSGDEAGDTDDVDRVNSASEQNESTEASSVEESASNETEAASIGDTMAESDNDNPDGTGSGGGADKTNEMTLDVEQLAEHTMFSVKTLKEMDDEMLEKLEKEVIQQVLGGGSGAEEEAAPDEKQNTEDDTVTNNEDTDYVTEEQLDSRLDEFEGQITNSVASTVEEAVEDTVEDKLDDINTNTQDIKTEENVEIVANALDISEEAAESLPDDDFESQLRSTRQNAMGAVPGQMSRDYGNTSTDEEFQDYPAGGRSSYENRKEADD